MTQDQCLIQRIFQSRVAFFQLERREYPASFPLTNVDEPFWEGLNRFYISLLEGKNKARVEIQQLEGEGVLVAKFAM